MREQAKYSDMDRAAALTALAANGGNIKQTAAQLTIPMQTLHEWAKGRVHPDVTTMKETMMEQLADRMETLAQTCLNLLTPEKLGEASAAQLATITGIAVDKMQVLRGKPDSIAMAPSRTTEENYQLVQSLYEKYKALKAQDEAQSQGAEEGN